MKGCEGHSGERFPRPLESQGGGRLQWSVRGLEALGSLGAKGCGGAGSVGSQGLENPMPMGNFGDLRDVAWGSQES